VQRKRPPGAGARRLVAPGRFGRKFRSCAKNKNPSDQWRAFDRFFRSVVALGETRGLCAIGCLRSSSPPSSSFPRNIARTGRWVNRRALRCRSLSDGRWGAGEPFRTSARRPPGACGDDAGRLPPRRGASAGRLRGRCGGLAGIIGIKRDGDWVGSGRIADRRLQKLHCGIERRGNLASVMQNLQRGWARPPTGTRFGARRCEAAEEACLAGTDSLSYLCLT
jgi:hypothetical protein